MKREGVKRLSGAVPRYGKTKRYMKINAADKTNLIRGRVTARVS